MSQKLLLMYTLDPRGAKVGGIETHIRLVIKHHPDDFEIIMVGIDEKGDLPLGVPQKINFQNRAITFFPVASISENSVNSAAKQLSQSITLRYVLGCIRFLPKLFSLTRGEKVSADLHRFEFALIPKLLGLKSVQMVHGEGKKGEKMDSLISRFWFLHAGNEWLSLRLANHIFGVNHNVVKRIAAMSPSLAAKAEMMTVSVDTDVFFPHAFDLQDGVFKIIFAGRLDEFKDPPLMFSMLSQLHEILNGKCEFHYVGSTDPARYPEFDAIKSFTIMHGFRTPAELAEITVRCHAGILTSYFEGMPCYLLETLASGRPVGAIRLPQYDPLIIKTESGALVERSEDRAADAKALAQAFASLWQEIQSGVIQPQSVAAKTTPYRVDTQMRRLFAVHRGFF